MTLKQVCQTNKQFLALIEDRKSGIHTVNGLEKALNGPVAFVRELRSCIASSQEVGAWNSKETRIWNGIAKNLQPLCYEEERATQQRGQENKLFQLELRILEYPEKIHQKGRHLILQSSLQVMTSIRSPNMSPSSALRFVPQKAKWSEMEVILTSDAILLLKKSKRNKGMFDFKARHPLTQVISADLAGNLELRILISDSIFILRTESQTDAEQWFSEIRQHIPNSGELTERKDYVSGIGTSASASNLSRHSMRSGESDEQKSVSDMEDGEAKKRKKRSTSNSSSDAKIQSILPSTKQLSPPSSSNNARRSSTEAKRSKFTKSHSVATISSEIAPRSLGRIKMTKRGAESPGSSSTYAIKDCPAEGGRKPSNGSPPPEEVKRKKIGSTTGNPSTSASATSLTSTASSSPSSSTTVSLSPSTGSISKLDLTIPRLTSPTRNFSSASSSTATATTTTTTTATAVVIEPPSSQKKYLLHPPRPFQALDHSSDYEESEDEPIRGSLSQNADQLAFFKPANREGSFGRNLDSSSMRELRSGSIDDMSARDPPTAPHFDSAQKNSTFTTTTITSSYNNKKGVYASQMGQSQEEEQHQQQQQQQQQSPSKQRGDFLDVDLIISTVRRMESDLATLKRALSDYGVNL
jgi:hypothetical protein